MGLEMYIGYGALNFARVLFKACAQLSVVNGKYIWIMPTSFVLGVLEVITWATPGVVAVKEGLVSLPMLFLCVVLGVSGGLGAMLAMRIHGVKNANGGDHGS